MFGEVFDTTKTLHLALHHPRPDAGGAGLPVPGRGPQLRLARASRPTRSATFFAGDDWYTDADSNVYQLPTFLGNHDMGRIGSFVAGRQPRRRRRRVAGPRPARARADVLLPRQPGRSTTATSRASPAPAATRTPGRRCSPAGCPSTSTTTCSAPTPPTRRTTSSPRHPLYRAIGDLAALTRQHPALRNGAHQHRYADRRRPASTRSPGSTAGSQREYVVALNNSEQAADRGDPDLRSPGGTSSGSTATGADRPRSAADGTLTADRPAAVHGGLRSRPAGSRARRRRPPCRLAGAARRPPSPAAACR